MIRALQLADLRSVQDLVVAAGMFTRDEVGFLADELAPQTDQHPDTSQDGRACEVVASDRGIAGVVYYRPEEAADGVWDLTMIAVDPARQRTGIGRQLLQHVESTVSARGARMLAIRTSSTSEYDRARAFYEHAGYVRAALIADWWTEGDDLVLYVKRLMPDAQRS